MKAWIKEAISQWAEEGIELNKGASLLDIQNVENQIGYKFPKDFKELYTVVNGFADFECTGFMLSLWSLSRIVNDYDKAKEFIIFSDHSLSICQYGFDKQLENSIFKTYTHHQQGPCQHVAKSFKNMIQLININSELLF